MKKNGRNSEMGILFFIKIKTPNWISQKKKKKKKSFAVRLRMKKEKWQLKKKKVEPSLKSNGMLRNF